MSDSWYSRALNRARGTEPQPGVQSYASPPAGPVRYLPQEAPIQRYVTPQAPTQPQAARLDQKQQQSDLSTLLKIQDAGQGTPGIGARLNPDNCPNCGDKLFFETLGKGKRRGPEPAPHCFSCGYNGLFEQGLQSSWGG